MSATATVPYAPRRLPVIGHLARLARDPLRFFDEQRTCGPVVRIRLGRRPTYIINDPALARHIQVRGNGREFDKGGPFINAFTQATGEGLATSKTERHRRQRPLVQPAFHHTRMAGYATRMSQCAVEHVASWRSGQVIDMDADMAQLAAASLGSTLFMGPGGREAVETFQRILPVFFAGLTTRMLFPAIARIPLANNRRFDRIVRDIHSTIDDLVRRSRNQDADTQGIVSLLVSPDAQANGRLTDEEIHEHIFQFLLGGAETTGSLMAWTLHVLATHPHEYDRLQSEIDTVLGGRDPAYEDLTRLPHLQNVILEVLRLHPPVVMTSRVTLTETELGGYPLPRDADVFISPYTMQRDPELFPAPSRFDPDRWTTSRVRREQRDAFMPFGVGVRKCIGESFALVEAAVALTVILKRWRIEQVHGAEVKPRVRMTQRPVGARLSVESRTH